MDTLLKSNVKKICDCEVLLPYKINHNVDCFRQIMEVNKNVENKKEIC